MKQLNWLWSLNLIFELLEEAELVAEVWAMVELHVKMVGESAKVGESFRAEQLRKRTGKG